MHNFSLIAEKYYCAQINEQGGMFMTQLNQLELQNLRHLIGSHETSAKKLETYAQKSTDPEVKQMFLKSSQDARSTKQKLMSFLN